MPPDNRTFEIVPDARLSDEQISSLLEQVYVQGGHTQPSVAERIFAPSTVRARGTLLAAFDRKSRDLLGMIIVVEPGGAARQIARGGEAELHLLGVFPEARGKGVGAALVTAAMKFARSQGWSQIVLSTQKHMTSAQTIYTAAGFKRAAARDWARSDTQFLVFEY